MSNQGFSTNLISQLNRYLKEEENKTDPDKLDQETSPASISEVWSAERYREEICKELTQRIANLHNKSLSRTEVYTLNEKVNLLLQKKQSWEERILELNGPDYGSERKSCMLEYLLTDETKINFLLKDFDSFEAHYYFGEAIRLPGVQQNIKRRIREFQDWKNKRKKS